MKEISVVGGMGMTVPAASSEDGHRCEVDSQHSAVSEATGLAKGSAVILFSMVLAGAFAGLTSIVVARTIGVEEFGIYSILISIQGMVVVFAGLGIGTSLGKLIAEYMVEKDAYASRIAIIGIRIVLAVSLVFALLLAVFRNQIGTGFYGEPTVGRYLPLLGAVIVANVLFLTALGIAQGCQRSNLISAMRFMSAAGTLILVSLATPILGIEGALIGVMGAQLTVALTGLFWIGNTGFRLSGGYDSRSVDWKLLQRILSFSVPILMASSLVGPVYWIGNTELALKSGFVELGYFAVAFSVFVAVGMIPQALTIPLMPRVSETQVRSPVKIQELMAQSLRVCILVVFPVVLAIGLYSGPLITLVFGEDYEPAAQPVFLICIAAFFASISSVIGALITGTGRVWLGLSLNVIWATTFVSTSLLCAPMWGAVGLAFAYAFSYGIHYLTSRMASGAWLSISLRDSDKSVLLCGLFIIIGYLFITNLGSLQYHISAVFILMGFLAILAGDASSRRIVTSLITRVRECLRQTDTPK